MQKIRNDKTLGNNIRNIRKKAGLTQSDVTSKLRLQGLSITRSIYSQIECGTYNIKATEIVGLSKIFGVLIDDFFSGIELVTDNKSNLE